GSKNELSPMPLKPEEPQRRDELIGRVPAPDLETAKGLSDKDKTTLEERRGLIGSKTKTEAQDGTEIVSLGQEFMDGSLKYYFAQGHTIYAGINEHYKLGSISHYVLITDLVERFGDHFVYEADDPFYGRVFILTPPADFATLK